MPQSVFEARSKRLAAEALVPLADAKLRYAAHPKFRQIWDSIDKIARLDGRSLTEYDLDKSKAKVPVDALKKIDTTIRKIDLRAKPIDVAKTGSLRPLASTPGGGTTPQTDAYVSATGQGKRLKHGTAGMELKKAEESAQKTVQDILTGRGTVLEGLGNNPLTQAVGYIGGTLASTPASIGEGVMFLLDPKYREQVNPQGTTPQDFLGAAVKLYANIGAPGAGRVATAGIAKGVEAGLPGSARAVDASLAREMSRGLKEADSVTIGRALMDQGLDAKTAARTAYSMSQVARASSLDDLETAFVAQDINVLFQRQKAGQLALPETQASIAARTTVPALPDPQTPKFLNDTWEQSWRFYTKALLERSKSGNMAKTPKWKDLRARLQASLDEGKPIPEVEDFLRGEFESKGAIPVPAKGFADEPTSAFQGPREAPTSPGVEARVQEPGPQGPEARTTVEEPRPAEPAATEPPPKAQAKPQAPLDDTTDDVLKSPKLDDIAKVRRSLGLPKYVKEGRTWESVIAQVAKKRLYNQSESIAQDVIKKGRLLNEEETVAVGVGIRNLQSKLKKFYVQKADFIEKGDQAAADLLDETIRNAEERLEPMLSALEKARSRTGATLNIGKIALPARWDFSSLKAKAVAKAGRKLKPDEEAKVAKRAQAVKRAEEDYIKAESRWVKARVTAALKGLDFGSPVVRVSKIDNGAFSDDAAAKALKRLKNRSGFGPSRTRRGAANLPVDDAEALIVWLGNKVAKGAKSVENLVRDAQDLVHGLDESEGVEAVQEAIRRLSIEKGKGKSLGKNVYIEGEWGIADSDIGGAREQLTAMARQISDQFYEPGVMLDRVEEMQKQLDRLEGYVKKGDKAQADKVRGELQKLGQDFNKGVKEGEDFLQSGDFAIADKSVADARRRWKAMMADTESYIASLEPTGFIDATRAFFRAMGFTNVVNRFFDVANNQLRLVVEGAGKPLDQPLERLLFPKLLKERQSVVGGANIRRGREAAQGYWKRVGERIVRQATTGESRLLTKVGAPRNVNTAANFVAGTGKEKAAKAFDSVTNSLNRLPGYTDIAASQWVEDVTLLELVDNFVRFEARGKNWTPDQIALKKMDVIANVDGKYDELYSAALEEANRAVFTHDAWIDAVIGSTENALRRSQSGKLSMLAFDTFITRYPRIFAKIADYATDFVAGAPKAAVRSIGSKAKAKAARKAGEEFVMPLHEQRLITQLVRRNMQGAAIVALGTFAAKYELGTLDEKKQFIDHGDLDNLGGPFALFLTAWDHAKLKEWVEDGEITEKQAQKIAFQTKTNLIANQPLLGETDRALGALIKGEAIEKFLGGKLSATLFPGIMREAARRTDDVRIRETKDESSLQTILNEFKKNVPVVRKTLPARGD